MVTSDDKGIRINLKKVIDDSYDITIGVKMFPEIARSLLELNLSSRYAIVTDSNARPLYAERLKVILAYQGIDADIFSFKAGEKSKRAEICLRIMGEMADKKYGRDSAVIALGGGVVGDMTGWIAANYLRGIPYIQIPTTTTSQVDSSIGGKTGVDIEQGKNLIGLFNHPRRVFIYVSTLNTLPEKEYVSGLAEMVKHGIVQDKSFFEFLNDKSHLIKSDCRDPDTWVYLAIQNCSIKGNVVEQDPDEKGLRRILNYGHTVGHSIEKLSNYEILHGYCVSIGMMVAGRIAMNYGFSETDLKKQEDLLIKLGLPTKIPPEISDKDIIEVTSIDKKAKGGKERYCLPETIGKMHEFDKEYATHVDDEVVIKALQKTR